MHNYLKMEHVSYTLYYIFLHVNIGIASVPLWYEMYMSGTATKLTVKFIRIKHLFRRIIIN